MDSAVEIQNVLTVAEKLTVNLLTKDHPGQHI